jgi:hypothetical protein
VQSTAAYSFKGLSQIIKLMAELGTLRVREEKGEPTRCFDSERIWQQEENLKCARSLEPQRLQPWCSQRYRHPLNQVIPTIIPTAYKAVTTAFRGCVSSQATGSAWRRPPGELRIVGRTLDLRLRMDGSRGADDFIRYSDRTTCDARLESLRA